MSATHSPQGVRTKTVKKSARAIIEKYYSRLTMDFHTNKRVCDEVAIIPSKRMRNKIAGFVTHLMKRIQRGPVRGISLKLQEEERERRMDFVPEVVHQLVVLFSPRVKTLIVLCQVLHMCCCRSVQNCTVICATDHVQLRPSELRIVLGSPIFP